MKRVRLTKLESTHNNLRTDVVEGILLSPLHLGYPIYVECEPLNKLDDYRRCVTTTPIVSIEGDIYKTKNSTYRIEVLE
jgi:hypothetical protein